MRLITACLISLFAVNTYAADERIASEIVKKYSETIACQLPDVGDQKNQYKAVQIDPGFADMEGLGMKFVVYWEGDVGCSGGNGTVVPNFTVVEKSGFMSADPVVIPEYKFPVLSLVTLTKMSAKAGKLMIEGIAYGPNDHKVKPTKRVSYTLKLVDQEFLLQ